MFSSRCGDSSLQADRRIGPNTSLRAPASYTLHHTQAPQQNSRYCLCLVRATYFPFQWTSNRRYLDTEWWHGIFLALRSKRRTHFRSRAHETRDARRSRAALTPPRQRQTERGRKTRSASQHLAASVSGPKPSEPIRPNNETTGQKGGQTAPALLGSYEYPCWFAVA
jgi:hypothetical protein